MISEDIKKNSQNIFQSGFPINVSFAPEKLYELAKMDGAIILDEDASKILDANVHLVPSSSINTSETGMRHRAAERVSKQLECLVLAISNRRNLITAYYKKDKYVLNDITFLLGRVSQALYTLEKYRENFDKMVKRNESAEFENRVILKNIVEILTKGLEILKIRDRLKAYIIELGKEGILAKMQLSEVIGDLEDLIMMFIKDYIKEEEQECDSDEVFDKLRKLKDFGPLVISRILGYEIANIGQLEEVSITTRGHRILQYTAKIPTTISDNVVKTFKNISEISSADVKELKTVEGIGHKRAIAIRDTIDTLKKKTSKVSNE